MTASRSDPVGAAWPSLLLAAAALASGCSAATAADAPARPNLVVILADDIGYGDLGCYGATRVKTPTLDRMAAQGLRFTDAHSPSSLCSPTRYALLTGRYAWRHPPVARGVLSGEAPLCIPTDCPTLPSLLKSAGYATAVVGKWHLGLGKEGKTDYNRDLVPGPLEIGFDYFFGFPATGDRVPCVYIENRRVVGLDPGDPIALDYSIPRGHPESLVNGIPRIGRMTGGHAARWKDETIADTLTRKAVEFIERSKDRPFFLYFATHDIHVPRVPHPRFRGTSRCGVRGDVIQAFDESVREVLAAIDRAGLADRTLVMVTSDNGGILDTNGPDTVNAGTAGTNNGHPQNGPLRGTKGVLYEGGHRVPFLARWTGRVQPGVSDQLICHVDLAASCAALAGRDLLADAAPDSFNVLPALLGEGPSPRGHLVMHAGALAIRQGPWKLIPRAGGGGRRLNPARKDDDQSAAGELYHLAEDLGETKDVAAQHPQRVKELGDLLRQVREKGRSR